MWLFRFRTFAVPRVGDEVVQELVYSSKAAAYDHLSQLLQQLSLKVARRSQGSPAADAQLPGNAALRTGGVQDAGLRIGSVHDTVLPIGNAASLPASRPVSRPASSQVIGAADQPLHDREDGLSWGLGVHKILHNLSIPTSGNAPQGEIHIEDLGHAVARALTPQLSYDCEFAQMHTVPPELVTLHSDLRLWRP